MSSRKVVVIGAGVIGLAVARSLASEGCTVTVVERGTVGRGASWAAAGMLAPSAEAQFGEEALVTFGRAAVESYEAFAQALERESGICVDYEAVHTLVVAVDRDDVADLKHLKAYQEKLNLPVTWLTPSRVREMEPWLGPRVAGAIHSPTDHRVDNRKVVEALQRSLAQRNVRILENSPASLEWSGDRLTGVRTPDQVLTADDVVVCAGAWSAEIPSLPERLRPPVRPVKGQMMSVRLEGGIELHHTIRTPRVYLIPRRDGRLIIGATQEEKGFDQRLTAGGLFTLLENAYEVFPAIYELPVEDTWTGLRPGCRDNLPIIGPTKTPGLWMATGHFRNGILLAAATAELLANQLVHEANASGPFAPGRYGL